MMSTVALRLRVGFVNEGVWIMAYGRRRFRGRRSFGRRGRRSFSGRRGGMRRRVLRIGNRM